MPPLCYQTTSVQGTDAEPAIAVFRAQNAERLGVSVEQYPGEPSRTPMEALRIRTSCNSAYVFLPSPIDDAWRG